MVDARWNTLFPNQDCCWLPKASPPLHICIKLYGGESELYEGRKRPSPWSGCGARRLAHHQVPHHASRPGIVRFRPLDHHLTRPALWIAPDFSWRGSTFRIQEANISLQLLLHAYLGPTETHHSPSLAPALYNPRTPGKSKPE